MIARRLSFPSDRVMDMSIWLLSPFMRLRGPLHGAIHPRDLFDEDATLCILMRMSMPPAPGDEAIFFYIGR